MFHLRTPFDGVVDFHFAISMSCKCRVLSKGGFQDLIGLAASRNWMVPGGTSPQHDDVIERVPYHPFVHHPYSKRTLRFEL